MKRSTFIFFFMVLFLYAQGVVTAADISDFKFQAPVKSEKYSYPVRLMLPHEIIKKTSAGFSDVRLFDDTGVEIPYVIYAQSRPKQTPKYFSWEIVNYQYTNTTQTIVLKRPKNINMARDLRISTKARDFAKKVKLYTSQDQKAWELLATDSFYDFSSQVDFRKNELKIPEITGPYLKVVLTDTVKPITGEERMRFQYKDLSFSLNETIKGEIKINGFTSYIGKKSKEKYLHDEFGIQSPKTFIDKDGNTIVVLGKLNVPADNISLSIKNPYFYRRVEVWIAEEDIEELYRAVGKNVLYRIPDISETKTTFPAHFIRPAYVRLKIINKDNPFLAIENVKIKWARRNLYFMPEKDRSYTLYYGGGNIRMPDYELKRMISNQYDKLMSYDEWGIGNIQENSAYSPRPDDFLAQRVQKYLFVGLVLLLVFGLGFWVFNLLKKISMDKSN
jgi:hypothetical protein